MEAIKYEYLSDGYEQELVLRDEVLRKPHGVSLTEKDKELDEDAIHFGIFEEGNLVASGHMLLEGPYIARAKQIVVAQNYQKAGLGRDIMEAIENEAAALGAYKVVLSARDYAIGFYEKLGYKQLDEHFEVFGIPHTEMFKQL